MCVSVKFCSWLYDCIHLCYFTLWWKKIVCVYDYIKFAHNLMTVYACIYCPQQYDCASAFLCMHYSDVITSAMASQITTLTIVYSTVCSGADKKTSKLRVTGLCEGNSPMTGEFPAQRASNAEIFSILWRYHMIIWMCVYICAFAHYRMTAHVCAFAHICTSLHISIRSCIWDDWVHM